MRAKLVEDAMGGVAAPAATVNNVPGAGTPSPAATSANTGAQFTSQEAVGSGDKWGDGPMYDQEGKVKTKSESKKKKDKKAKSKSKAGGLGVSEGNINPYDKIAKMMTDRLGTPQPFEQKGDPATNEVKQKGWKLPKEQKFKITKLSDFKKTQFPDLKEGKEEPREQESLKDIKAKELLNNLAIPYIYRKAPSGEYRVYLEGDVNKIVEKLENMDWAVEKPNKETRIFRKDGQMLTIVADGKDLPRAIYKDIPENTGMIESILSKKYVSNSLEPYI